MPSRWADSARDAAEDARRKEERAEKKRIKIEKARLAEEKEKKKAAEAAAALQLERNADERPAKRRRISADDAQTTGGSKSKTLRFDLPGWNYAGLSSKFKVLNAIEEGSYGYVSRAQDTTTSALVALKKLKIDPYRDGGFPVTALREIQTLTAANNHRHIVHLKEVVADAPSSTAMTPNPYGDVYLVMEFLEHDLKTLQEEMEEPFRPSEIKTLLLQLASGVEFLHDHSILHRDLKTSNILLNNRGEVKLADFGMARFCGDPPPANLTQLVVTLWYRAPELLLGAMTYSSAIDTWSLGCIFAELLTREPLLQGKNEADQLGKIFDVCGVPSEESWPGVTRLPNAKSLRLPAASRTQPGNLRTNLQTRFPSLSESGREALASLLSLDPRRRCTARELLSHPYFAEEPRPKPTSMFPTFPSKAGQEKRKRWTSPPAPIRGETVSHFSRHDFSNVFTGRNEIK
ncbi:serine/threonine protein kinase, CMGC family, CDC2/CDK subfamily [Polychaeton citri CBS 116435]|uniref:cyclin-dependent kinase n=1 Tax=Polychaeton citri CBS 116435 TaxID=1314669 RepID=A0A9P4QHQ0_9PEZI|nr:serine/threonine protein kinase, CMGC family, CDC2/CDK subfamily [Polychaeton citri CBS 116435]